VAVLIVFAVLGTIGVAVPLAIYFAIGDHAEHMVQRLRHWLAHNSPVIMTVLLVVIGSKILGDAISALTWYGSGTKGRAPQNLLRPSAPRRNRNAGSIPAASIPLFKPNPVCAECHAARGIESGSMLS
jgi:hypothetical protein